MKVEINEDILNKLKERAKEKNMSSVEEYIEDILKQVVEKLEKGKPSSKKKDEDAIKERLKSLGYI